MNKLVIPLLFLLLLSGCKDDTTKVNEVNGIEKDLQSQIAQLEIEKKQLKDQVTEMQKILDEERDSLRTTMNLTFKLLTAMEKKDFIYISSIASSNVQIDEQDSSILFDQQNYRLELTDKTVHNLENLEYRFYDLEDDKMTIGFAEYFLEVHSTTYFEFINVEGTWLINYIVTNP